MAVYGAWHSAVFPRQKKLPSLKTIMRQFENPKPVKPQSVEVLRAKVFALNVAFGGRDLTGGKHG